VGSRFGTACKGLAYRSFVLLCVCVCVCVRACVCVCAPAGLAERLKLPLEVILSLKDDVAP
jgi:hypothetical protein